MRINAPGIIDDLLLSVACLGEAWSKRYSQRIGRLVRHVAVSAHEAVWRIRRRRGTTVDAGVLRCAQSSNPCALPRYPLSAAQLPPVPPRAVELLQGGCRLADGTDVRIEKLSWRRSPFGGTGSMDRLLFHSLYWVQELLEAYHETRLEEYLEQAKRITGKWISECLYAEKEDVLWDDHGTALRAITLCRLWGVSLAGEPVGAPFMGDLLSALERHARKLAHPLFYRPGHNHGVVQAYALLAVGLLLPNHPDSIGWVRSGLSRLEKQMAENVSPEGVHREHSPAYHFFVLRHFLCAFDLARSHGRSFSAVFQVRLRKMIRCGAHFVKPDGMLPPLGDTPRTSPERITKEELTAWSGRAVEEYLYSISSGREGRPPESSGVFFPGGGVAIFHSGWGENIPVVEEHYLAYRVSTYDTSHKHRDVFSFDLYAYGSDLIVDSGGPYRYGDKERKYFLSTSAHNTVVVDDADQRIGESRVHRWVHTSAFDLLDAEHQNYPGVRHRRALFFLRPDYYILLDRIESDRPHRYSQLFHFRPSLRVEIDGNAVYTADPSGGATVKLVPLSVSDLGFLLHRGSLDPRRGWVCTGDQEMAPASVVEYQRSGRSAVFAVLIVPEPPGRRRQVHAVIEGDPFLGDICVQVNIDGRRDEIQILHSGEATFRRMATDDCRI